MLKYRTPHNEGRFMVRIDLDALHREAAAYFRDMCKALEQVEQNEPVCSAIELLLQKVVSRGLRIGAFTVPGVIALKRIPSFANSIANARVTDSRPPFVRLARLAERHSTGWLTSEVVTATTCPDF